MMVFNGVWSLTVYDFEAYKAIHGYDGLHSVTDDFIDAHIYIDYVF